MAIPLYDDFINPVGQFPNYDTYDAAQRTQLAAQKHVDLRSFPTVPGLPLSMLTLDSETMATLDTMTIADLEDTIVQPETWTVGTVGPFSSYNNFNALTLACSIGVTSTQSVMTVGSSLAGFANTDFISLALPSFPLTSLNTASSYLDFTSDPSGSFTNSPIDSLVFSSSTTALVAGDCEARFPLSQLVNVDRHSITGVRLRFTATAACTVHCMALRCLAASWVFAPVDQNTLYGRLQATVPPSGSLAQVHTFPVASAGVTPADWPVLFWSDGAQGPQAVDAEIGAVIQTGANTALNTFTLYFRELAMIPRTMSDLDGLTMGGVEDLGSELQYTPGTLDTFSQSRYVTASVQWGTSSAAHIKDQSGTGYDFATFSLSAHSTYYLLVRLEDDSLRMQIYPVDAAGQVDWTTVVFDSTAVVDGTFLPRRRGRLGWYAQLNEGGTYIQRLRPRRIVFGEYRSAPLTSMTPVEGARLYTSTTPDAELYSGATAVGDTVLSPDTTKSRSGRCIRVVCQGRQPSEGVQTAPLRFENLYDSVIEFDVLAPTGASLTAELQGEGRIIPLYVPPLPVNQWTHITIPLQPIASLFMPGPYSFTLVQALPAPVTWYLDNPSVRARAVAWAGRGQAGDPLKVVDPPWIPYGDALNDPQDGVLVGRGTSLQIRGQALTQDATITSVTILPRYAELGRFVWSDQMPTYPAAPVPNFVISSIVGVPTAIVCDASGSTASGGIAAYYWSFGDDNHAFGKTITHTYTLHGTYTINLVLVDSLGQKVSQRQSVTV